MSIDGDSMHYLRWMSYRPLPIEGNARDFRFDLSANSRQFLTVFSRSCCGLSIFQVGPAQCITCLDGSLCPADMIADENIINAPSHQN